MGVAALVKCARGASSDLYAWSALYGSKILKYVLRSNVSGCTGTRGKVGDTWTHACRLSAVFLFGMGSVC